MSNSGKVLRGLIALAVAAGLGTLIGWLVGALHGDVAPISVAATTNQSVAMRPTEAAPIPSPAPALKPLPTTPDPALINKQAEHGAPNWEDKLDDVLLSDSDENSKADKILAMIPNAPPEVQTELAHHLVNMVQDDHYDGTAQLLTNAATSPDVSDVLMNDLLNRGNNVKLPMLLAVARNDNHPLRSQALDLLGMLTQEDDGTNWDQWSTTVNTWLANNQ